MGTQNRRTSTQNENLWGWWEDDTILSGRGDDTLAGAQGHDTIYGGDGDDWIRDYTWSYAGGSVVVDRPGRGEYAHDAAPLDRNGVDYHESGNDRFYGEGGNDALAGFSGHDLLDGGDDDDTLWGGTGRDTLRGGDDNDELFGNEGDDSLSGGAHADTLSGGSGDDTIDGGSGRDLLTFEAHVMRGGDHLVVDLADEGGDGRAQLIFDGDPDGPQSETDLLRGIEDVTGGYAGDEIRGNAAANRLSGGDGDDVLMGRRGNDTLEGGEGIDRADYSYIGAGASGSLLAGLEGVTVVLGTATEAGRSSYAWTRYNPAGYVTEADQDLITGIENVTGSGYADTLTGNGEANDLAGLAGHDLLDGGAGSDTLTGGAGHDTLVGGAGTDILDGGAGQDVFRFEAASDSPTNPVSPGRGSDLILGFQDDASGHDLIDLSRLGVTAADLGFLTLRDPAQGGAIVSMMTVNTDDDLASELTIRFDRVIPTLDAGDVLF
ncbi:MAG: hypothetical protein K2X71_15165 [Methylobacterium sp.]|uniref:calcium-binding protein n=1 Tax=Methylobacterium sp. TaxID=409 RepID=UPI002584A7D2|nr:calcium-binding protein [Methylobacterium sp.]MBY0297354.1 hypothetical protein [Methylobacterium sp.]